MVSQHELGGCPASLFHEWRAVAYYFPDGFFRVVAYGYQFDILVVTYLKFFLQLLQEFIEDGRVAVYAEREADGGVLHQVQLEFVSRKYGKDVTEFFFGDEGKISWSEG